MDPPSTTNQTTPSTPLPTPTTNPTVTHGPNPANLNTTVPTSTQTGPVLTFSPSSTVPPFASFFPTSGQSSSTQQIPPNQFQPSSTIVHTTSAFQPSNQSGFIYPSSQFVQSSGVRGDGFDDGYDEEFGGYEEESYYYYGNQGGNLGNQGGMIYQPRPQVEQVQEPVRPPTGVQQVRPHGPQVQRPLFQRVIPLQQAQHQYQQPFAPQGPMQGQMGRPRVPLGVPRRHNREAVRGIEAHFRPVITNNPSPVVIPQNNQGRTFEVRTNSLQSLPKYKGLATEEPYFHLEAYDSLCNTIGGQGFSSDEVKLVLFQFSLEDRAKRWFYTLPSASIYTWAEMQQRFLE